MYLPRFIVAVLLIVLVPAASTRACPELEYKIGRDVPAVRQLQFREYDAHIAELERSTTYHLAEPLAFQNRASGPSANEIPLNYQAYTNASIVQKRKLDRSLQNGEKLYTGLSFGYDVTAGYKEVGRIDYLVVKDGRVVEVGLPTNHLTYEFRKHIFGNQLSEAQVARLKQLSSELIQDLRTNPRNVAALQEFAKARDWPPGLENEGGLAYFNVTSEWLLDWAKKRGYNATNLRDAGWIKIDHRGITVLSPDSIRIPFFDNPQQSVVTITRIRRMGGPGPKYLSFPKDRSLTHEIFGVQGKLYNSWKLPMVRGKEVVITEGEFKCLVATKKTGIVHLGIPGITQFDRGMLKAILDAGPAKITVLMDRDPIGKAMMRVDGVSDAQRAAYQIAREIEIEARPLGIEVKVAKLPDVFNGGKVGVDDLVLEFGNKPYLDALNSAVSPETFAKDAGLDPYLQELLSYRRILRQSIKDYESSSIRGGPKVRPETFNKAKQSLSEVENQIEWILSRNYENARAINQPHPKYATLPQVYSPIQGIGVRTRVENTVNASQFKNNIVMLDFVTRDMNPNLCRIKPCFQIKQSGAQINTEFQGFQQAGLTRLSGDMQRALGFMEKQGLAVKTKSDFEMAALISDLLKKFPPDDYIYEFNVEVYRNDGARSLIPVVILSKSSGNVVATSRLQTESNQSDPALFENVRSILR